LGSGRDEKRVLAGGGMISGGGDSRGSSSGGAKEEVGGIESAMVPMEGDERKASSEAAMADAGKDSGGGRSSQVVASAAMALAGNCGAGGVTMEQATVVSTVDVEVDGKTGRVTGGPADRGANGEIGVGRGAVLQKASSDGDLKEEDAVSGKDGKGEGGDRFGSENDSNLMDVVEEPPRPIFGIEGDREAVASFPGEWRGRESAAPSVPASIS
ncbi:unnamed protein product, partial [Choristocarpus tenellus]